MRNKLAMCLALAAAFVALGAPLDVPKYDVIAKEDTYEVRQYPATTWVSTTDEDPENVKAMFLRLFYYMQGANAKGRTLEMTAPMLRHHRADGNVTLMLYLPTALQKDAPAPTDAAVNITQLEAQQYAVWQFGGFATNEIWDEELDKFQNDINVTTDEYFAASYSGFHDLVDRRNEIWFVRNETSHGQEDQSDKI